MATTQDDPTFIERTLNAGAITSGTLTGYDFIALFPEMQVAEIKIVNASGANLQAIAAGKTLERITPSSRAKLTGIRIQSLLLTPDAEVLNKQITLILRGPPGASYRSA